MLTSQHRRSDRQRQAASAPLAGKHILVVDDVRSIRLVGQKLLKRAGATVRVAADGEMAVAAVAASMGPDLPPFDCVIMDFHMPRMDDLQALRKIRESYGDRAPPVVGLTADSSEQVAGQFHDAGAVGVLSKPYTVDTLVHTILENAQR